MGRIVLPAALCGAIALLGAALGYWTAGVELPVVLAAPLVTFAVVLIAGELAKKFSWRGG